MKRLTYLVAVLLLASFNLQAQWGPILGASRSSGGTVAQGNVFNEPWSASGGVNTWTNNGNATITQNAALTDSPPSYLTSYSAYCLNANYAGGGAAFPSTQYTLNSGSTATKYFRIYLKVTNSSLATGDHYGFFAVTENSNQTNICVAVKLHRDFDSKYYMQIQGGSSTSSDTPEVQLATWYRVEMKYVANGTGASILRVYNATTGVEITSGDTTTCNTGNNNVNYFTAGVCAASDNTVAVQVQIAGIGVSSTTWLGQ